MRKVFLTESDLFIYKNEIQAFLPRRIFDVHAHLLNIDCHPNLQKRSPETKELLQENVDMAYLEEWWRVLFPDSDVSGHVMGMPECGCNYRAENEFVVGEVNTKHNRVSILTHPQMSADELENDVLRFKPAGFKPYLVFSKNEKSQLSCITDFLPEKQIEIADRYGLCVTLHLAKPRGLADNQNLEDIERFVRQYPRCKFILAHCGRCFITPNMIDALKKLPVADNLWLDTSAVCDRGVFINLFSKYDRSRIVFGTDLVGATGFRGTYVRLGMTWDMCSGDMVRRHGGQEVKPTFAAYENLCALLHAARFCRLSQTDMENIFFNNAAKLFNLEI